ncbi:dihydroxyacetone kinase subunit DhaK [Streptomyces sodiiphilus]|uniref:Dihydroxyacetone kinase subunit DhaK n=2 Tax=Streptomyces sodiiphilus TaxID=226217 RepID=A0ABN2NYN4_9ACTN
MLINGADRVVEDALRGLAGAHPGLTVDTAHRIVLRGDAPVADKVALIAGGGSGHEPMPTGFVGHGMLDAACAGEVFAFPLPGRMARAAAAVDSGRGVLLMAGSDPRGAPGFDRAAELAEDEGVAVDAVLIADDMAIPGNGEGAGSRGAGGAVFVARLAGAAAESGASLEQVAALARRVAGSCRSCRITPSACGDTESSPAHGPAPGGGGPGAGGGGEPAHVQQAGAGTAGTVEPAVEGLLAELRPGGPVLLLVNGMGGTPLLELYAFTAEAHRLLARRRVSVARTLVGNYVTSLDTAGCSVTLCQADDTLLRLWDSPVRTPALRWGG